MGVGRSANKLRWGVGLTLNMFFSSLKDFSFLSRSFDKELLYRS